MTTVMSDGFSRTMILVASTIDSALFSESELVTRIYKKNYKFVNYAFVTGIMGIAINQLVLLTLARYLPLYLANFVAIGFAMFNNYTFTVGPLGYLFGLSKNPNPKTKVEK